MNFKVLSNGMAAKKSSLGIKAPIMICGRQIQAQNGKLMKKMLRMLKKEVSHLVPRGSITRWPALTMMPND